MSTSLRVMTWNVQGLDGPAQRQDLIAATIRDEAPDVLCLQEVMSTGHLASLLAGTGLHGTHQSEVLTYEPPFADRYGGTAVATRGGHRIVEVLDQRSSIAPDVPWCTLAVVVDLGEVGELLVIAAVSSWRLEAEAARERQAVALADLDARHRRDLPTIIAGDLNAGPDAASIRYLTGRQSVLGHSVHYHDAWETAALGPGHTWTTDNPRAAAEIAAVVRQPVHHRRLDYLLVGGADQHPTARATIGPVRLVGDRPGGEGLWASDHYGVVADLELSLDDD